MKGKRKVGGAGKSKKAALSLPSFVPFYFFRVRAFSLNGPDYLGTWNRLGQQRIYVKVKRNSLVEGTKRPREARLATLPWVTNQNKGFASSIISREVCYATALDTYQIGKFVCHNHHSWDVLGSPQILQGQMTSSPLPPRSRLREL